MASYLSLQQLHYAYPDGTTAVNNVTLNVPLGGVHCLIGRSGCGKTTLLKLAAGLLPATSGQITLNNQPVHAPTFEMGFVFQSPTLLNWLNVVDNVLLPLSLHQTIATQERTYAEQLLQQMGLQHLQHQHPQQLSGGQQSRVAIARALITHPRILFMDEPFAALDAITRDELQNDFLNLCQQQGTSVVFVTHDITEAVYLGDTVSVMNEGALTLSLPISLKRPRQPTVRYSAEFNQVSSQLRDAMHWGAGT